MVSNKTESVRHNNPLHLTADEIAIVELVRVLGLTREEALRRLAISPMEPSLPACQELQANLAAVAKDLSVAVEEFRQDVEP
jgi:hypothetical protein